MRVEWNKFELCSWYIVHVVSSCTCAGCPQPETSFLDKSFAPIRHNQSAVAGISLLPNPVLFGSAITPTISISCICTLIDSLCVRVRNGESRECEQHQPDDDQCCLSQLRPVILHYNRVLMRSSLSTHSPVIGALHGRAQVSQFYSRSRRGRHSRRCVQLTKKVDVNQEERPADDKQIRTWVACIATRAAISFSSHAANKYPPDVLQRASERDRNIS